MVAASAAAVRRTANVRAAAAAAAWPSRLAQQTRLRARQGRTRACVWLTPHGRTGAAVNIVRGGVRARGKTVSWLSDTSAHVIALRKAHRTAWSHPWPMATDMDDALMRALADMDPANRGPEAAAPQGAEEEEDDTADVAPGEDGGPEAGPPGEAGEDGAEGEQVAQPEGDAPGDAPAEQGDTAEGVPADGDEQGAPPMEEWKKEQLRCVFGAVHCRWPPGFCSFVCLPGRATHPLARPACPRATCSGALMSMLASESPLGLLDSGIARVTNLFSCTLSSLTADDTKAAAWEAAAAEEAAAEGEAEAKQKQRRFVVPEDDSQAVLPPGVESLLGMVAALGPVRILSGSADRSLRVWEPSRLADGAEACTAVLEGHSNWVHAVTDLGNHRCVSGSDDCTVRVWHVPSGKCEAVLKGHSGYVTCIVPLPNDRLLSGSDDTTLRIWALPAGGECEAVLAGHAGDVTCCCDCGGGLAVSGSRDKTLRVWRLVDGETTAKLRGHNNTVYSVTTITPTPQGAPRVASGSADGLVCIWNCAVGTCDRVLEGGRCTIYALCCLDDVFGSIVAGGSDACLRVWRPDDDQHPPVLMSGHADAVLTLASLPGGRCVSGSQDGTLRVWHPTAAVCEAVLKGHSNWVMAACPLHPAPVSSRAGRRGDDEDSD